MVANIADLRYLFYGGGHDAEYSFLQDANTAGITAADVLSLAQDSRTILGMEEFLYTDTGATVTNTASATTLVAGTKYDIAANSLAVGDELRIVAYGDLVNTGSNRDATFDVDLDGVTAAAFASSIAANAIVASASRRPWFVRTTATVRAIGASGTLDVLVEGHIGQAGAAATGLAFPDSSNLDGCGFYLDFPVDTTQALTVDVTVQPSAATTALSIRCKRIRISKLRVG